MTKLYKLDGAWVMADGLFVEKLTLPKLLEHARRLNEELEYVEEALEQQFGNQYEMPEVK